jgi:hypothetical protein
MKVSTVKYVFLLVIILAGFSCSEKRKDHSLSLDAYREAGMPDTNKKWNMADYMQAYNALAKIKWEQPLQLPRKDSEKSGSLFEHMVSRDYLSILRDSTMSLNAKAEQISGFIRIYDYWMDIYNVPMLTKNYYDREIVDFQIFNLQMMESMVNLAHQINESDDPADAALKYGYPSIKANYLTSLTNGLKTQNSTSGFLERDLNRMADSICASLMRNKEWMDSAAVSDVKRSLHSVMDSTSSDYIRSKYKSLEKSLVVSVPGT